MSLDVDNIDFKRKTVPVVEKGGLNHTHRISREGLEAVRDYLERGRPPDAEKWQSPPLFLSANTNPHGDGRLTPQVVNDLWN
jgi:site-specific recombinase XerD